MPNFLLVNMNSERIPRITVRKYFRAFAAWVGGSHIGQAEGLTEPNTNK